MGVLLATGFIVGESLFGVAFAGIVAATGSDAPQIALVGAGLRDRRAGRGRARLRGDWWPGSTAAPPAFRGLAVDAPPASG